MWAECILAPLLPAPSPFRLLSLTIDSLSIRNFVHRKSIRSQGHDNWWLSIFLNGETANAEDVVSSWIRRIHELTVGFRGKVRAYKDSSFTAGEYAVSSLFGSLGIVFQQTDFHACTVHALGHISVAHPNQVDAVHRDLVVQHQVSCY